MKKNKMMRIASVLLGAVLITTCVIGGTLAKYTTTITGSDTAIVANFDVSALGEEASTTTETATVNIFDESAIFHNNGTYTSGTDDPNVDNAVADAPAIIAPGTWGKFTYEITANSQVKVNYSIDYTIDNADVPLEWSLDGVDWEETLDNVGATEIDDTTVNVTIYWRWIFDGDNVVDTELGTADSLAKPSITIAVTFTQVD